ncbi:cystathionine gamma-synthase [Clavulina sp. PMI_390]|nr:cystathionine gamma-synthase [Clavulina sp. PMI_390]
MSAPNNVAAHDDQIGALFENLRVSTALLHADHHLVASPVAPDISLTTSEDPPSVKGDLNQDLQKPEYHIYSRYTQPVSTRAEAVLSKILNGQALTYRSGLSAAYAAIIHYQPKRLAIRAGYHGVHQILKIHKRSVPSFEVIDIDDKLQEGDLLWVETPLNPTGEARNLEHYVQQAHAVGAKILVDATFSPPPLADPFKFGVDCILHSGSKYFGGHSDLLCGVLAVPTVAEWNELWSDRTYLGTALGSLEAYLLLRSLRTLKVRVLAQSTTATALAGWLDELSKVPAGQELDGVPGGVVVKVMHTSLQAKTEPWVAAQHPGGYNPCFSICTSTARYAKELPFKLQLFTAATSLGGVESLMEQRYMSDPGEDPKLLRLSIGLEDLEDLKADFKQAITAILKVRHPVTPRGVV